MECDEDSLSWRSVLDNCLQWTSDRVFETLVSGDVVILHEAVASDLL